MTESGLSGEPGLRVLAVVEQQLRPGPGRVTTLLQVAMDSSVLGDLIRPWPAVLQVVSVGILVSGLIYNTGLTHLLGPQYLTVKSSGEAGKEWFEMMGVYEQTGEYHNKKPVWSRHDGTQKMFYTKGKVYI